jgi:hypothetical protein
MWGLRNERERSCKRRAASIVSLEVIFGEDPILGYITKAIFLFLFITFIYVNLRDE